MKTSTFENRTKDINKSTVGYQLAKTLLSGGSYLKGKPMVRPCYTSGRGRFTSNQNHTVDTIMCLQIAGLKRDIDFKLTNDAPRGSATGNLITLINRNKMIKN